MLDSLPNVVWTHAAGHEEAFKRPLKGRYDVVLFHDLYEKTTENTRKRLKDFIESGGGIVSNHHAIVDFTDWPWWYEEVIGGKYFTKPEDGHQASSFKEGVDFLVKPAKDKAGHPILKGVGPLWVNDELYKGMYLSPDIEVLMETTHPDNDPPMVYVGPYRKARVVYIQLGHSGSTMENPGFRRLISNAVNWVAKK
jgi:type 1 glutamine amidotransferase